MPRVLFTSNFLENDVYTYHARLAFASARELRDFLTRNTFPERDGWGVVIHRGPSRGYFTASVGHVPAHSPTRSITEL